MRPARRRLLTATLCLVGVVLVVSAVIYGRHNPGGKEDEVLRHARLEGFRLRDPNGALHDLAEWSGRPLLLNFWASWCKPCKEEIPLLVRLHAHHPQVDFIGVAIDDAEAVRAFLQRHQVDYTILVGEHDAIQLAAAVGNTTAAVPYTAVLDEEGGLIYTRTGTFDVHKLGDVLEGLHAVP